MPTTFTVFSLGTLPIWDTVEGNTTLVTGAVNAALGTYGSTGDPLYLDRQEFAPAGSGFGGGSTTTYDIDNNDSNDQFSIDGGPVQTFDALMVFNATITYVDGTTATITATVMQDVDGNTYWTPETTNNADQAAINAQAIVSLQLTSPIYANGVNTGYNLVADRADSMPLCFTPGAMITCPDGPRAVETLAVGDLVMTLDHGPQPIRWIGRRKVAAIGRLAPIRIKAGALGTTRDLEVSPQHRMLISGPQAEVLFGDHQVLAAAKHLVDGDMITVRQGGEVEYIHLLFDRHELIWANDAPAETLFLGETGEQALDADSLAEVRALFPDRIGGQQANCHTARPVLKAHEVAVWTRHMAQPAQAVKAAS